ncbi:MAG: alkaline phosphatase D family protein, partial [Salinivenus sp.]
VQGPQGEYRNNAIHGTGLKAGLTSEGRLFIGDTEAALDRSPGGDGAALHLTATPTGDGHTLTLSVLDGTSDAELGQVQRTGVSAAALAGNLALFGGVEEETTDEDPWGDPKLWLRHWTGRGAALTAHPGRAFGPILFAQHTLSRGTMTMTAQLPPMGAADGSTVRLQTREGGAWTSVAEADVHPRARTATVRVADWDDTRDVPYRLAYDYEGGDETHTHHYEGVVRRDPVDQDEVVVAGFSCAKDAAFPHPNVEGGARQHDPDVLAFTGDQYYEDTGGYGVQRQRTDVERATLDVLRKWILHGWAFGDLMRDRPSICLLDDHDVYHGNIWGEGGTQVDRWELHDNGGYFMPPEWVNAVQRMQTAHLPPPHDPTPVKNDISVYYTDMLYGRVSFALLEDRKWKTGPDGFLPPNPGRPDWIEDPDFDPASVDLDAARLLGDRQLSFLDEWAADWRGADMKAVVSQTTFAQVPTHHGADFRYLVADLDSNGWPQTPRDEALRRIRKGFAVHLGGDQHLPMLLRYGIEDFDDAPYNFCVPGIAVGYVRAFWPGKAEMDPRPADTAPTGEFTDGLGNKVTVRAVANPEEEVVAEDPLRTLANKSSGYGILRFDKENREITAECWPILSDPDRGAEAQYAGWPQTFSMLDNDPREPVAHLPQLSVTGTTDPMVQVVDEAADEIVYTLRIQGQTFRPPVYAEGAYTLRVGDDAKWRTTRTGLHPGDDGPLELSL